MIVYRFVLKNEKKEVSVEYRGVEKQEELLNYLNYFKKQGYEVLSHTA